MPMISILLALTVGFLVAHLIADLRSAVLTIRHPKDGIWTALTLAALIGHLAFDYLG